MGYGLGQFVTHVDPNLICGICAGVLEKAILTPCGHSFCEDCLQTWLGQNESSRRHCPACRREVYETTAVLALRGIIDGLLVKCNNEKHGCKLVLKLENLEGHLKRCDYTTVECSGCGESVARCELASHHDLCEAIITHTAKKLAQVKQDSLTIEELTKQLATLELDLKKTKDALKNSEGAVLRVERELTDMRHQINLHSREEEEFDPDWDPEYSYGYSPLSISQLASLVSRYLLNKPYYIDRNLVYAAIKRSYDYYHNYAGYSQDVHMLLAAAYASNWFTENQKWDFDSWLENIARQRFLR